MATISNLYLDAGSDFEVIITIKQSNGVVMNLTGYTAASQMRKSHDSSVYYNFEATIPVETSTQGKIKLRMPASQSELIPHGRWLYDVEVTLTQDDVIVVRKRVVEGIVEVTPQITQDVVP